MSRTLRNFACTAMTLSCLAGGTAAGWAAPLHLEISIGIRETDALGSTFAGIGGNGGTAGGIEIVDIDGQTLIADGTWQQFTLSPTSDTLTAFAGTTANSVLDGDFGVLEHIRIRSTDDPGPWIIYIDDVANGRTTITGFEGCAVGAEVMFRDPGFSGSTSTNVLAGSSSEVTDEASHSGSQSYRLTFEFVDNDDTRWVRLTTFDTTNLPHPQITWEENETISFWLMAMPASTQVSEPGTVALLGFGLAGLGALRRRRGRQS